MERSKKGRTGELTGIPRPLDHFKTLEVIQSRVEDLRTHLRHRDEGQKLYYTIDFSEVYSYLHYDSDLVKPISVSLDSSNPDKASNQHWLGLMHLFNTFTDGNPVYLMPPYALELWSYVRTMGNKVDPMRDLHMGILEQTRNLPPLSLKMIETAGDPDKISDGDWEQIFTLVQNNFEKLAVDVSELVSWVVRGNELKKLIQTNKLSHHIEHILSEHEGGMMAPSPPSTEDEFRVFEMFSTSLRTEKRYAKMIDARAILFLRNLNGALKKTNSKVIFITRDQAILKVSACLAEESWFGWSDIGDHIYGIETVFLDLILRGATTTQDQIDWIENTINMLDELKGSVSKLSEDIPVHESGAPDLARTADVIMNSASTRWDQAINTQLSLALDKTPWLGEHFRGGDLGAVLEKSGRLSREYTLLKKLWTYISEPEYREIADKYKENVWTEFMREQCSVNFLRIIKESTENPEQAKLTADSVGKILSESFIQQAGFSKTVLHSKSSLQMPSLQFISPKFQGLLSGFRPWIQEEQKRINDIGDTFLRIVSEAILAYEPESFLFMGFVLGMLDLWVEAMQVAELARKRDGEIRISELDYFISIAKCKIAAMNPDPGRALEHYVEAAEYIARARNESPSDPRYMKQDGTISLLYHESSNKLAITALPQADSDSAPNIRSWPDAIRLLDEALNETRDDRRLRVEILNNLAYAEAYAEPPSLDKAEKYLRMLENEVRDAKAEATPSIPADGWPFVEDTRLWIQALIARSRNDREAIEQSIRQEKQLLSRKDLMPKERQSVEQNMNKMRGWLSEVTTAEEQITS